MKRLIKSTNKKAFTLLEVLLAVAIGLTASTMILEGVVSTMQFSNNTAVYTRLAYEDYSAATLFIAQAHKNVKSYEYGTTADSTMKFDFSGATVSDVTINIETNKIKPGSVSMADLNVINFSGSYENLGSVVSANRTSATYTPMVCDCSCGAEFMRIGYDDDEAGIIPDYIGYYWFCSDNGSDNGCGARYKIN